jgi:hypothetical protein
VIHWKVSEAGVLVIQDDKNTLTQICFTSLDEMAHFARDLSAGVMAVANEVDKKTRDNEFRREFSDRW